MDSDNTLTVALFGIPEFEREMVDRIFALSGSRDNVYRSVDAAQNHTADIALVDTTSETGTEELERCHPDRKDFPSVVVASGKDPGSDYQVKRPFTVMRMLGALDRLVEDRLSGENRPKRPAAPAEIADDSAPPPPMEPAPPAGET